MDNRNATPSGYYDSDQSKTSSKRSFLFLFIFFIILIFGFLYYGFSGNIPISISGKATSNFSEEERDITIKASLTSLGNLDLNTEIEKIEILGNIRDLSVGKEKFELTGKNSLIIENFDGKISFNNVNLSKLEGKSSRVFIDGLPISSENKLNVKIGSFSYDYLKLNGFFLSSLSYKTSGTVRLNEEKIIINLDNEEISLDKFNGDLESKGNSFNLEGTIKKSSIIGSIDISLS